MRRYLAAASLLLAACGGAIEAFKPGPPPEVPTEPVPPDAAAPPRDAGATDAAKLDASPDVDAAKEPRYVITGDEAFDRTTGLTWYRRFTYGYSGPGQQPFHCGDGGVGTFRCATVAEGLTILVTKDGRELDLTPDGGHVGEFSVEFDEPFYWSQAISSMAADGCINLPVFSVSVECEGSLVNHLFVKVK